MQQTVLLSGSHGFIGSHLKKHLVQQNYNVIPIPRNVLYEAGSLKKLMSKYSPAYIIHCAAAGNMYGQNTNQEIFHASHPLFYMLEFARTIPVKGIINFSSSSVYLPHQTIYSATKKAGEALCKAYHDDYGIPAISLRPFSIYGEGEVDHRLIPTIFRSCLQGESMDLSPNATHDWVYINDLAERVKQWMNGSHRFAGGCYDVGTGFSTTNQVVVETIENITGKKATFGKKMNMRSFDNRDWVSSLPLTNPTMLQEGLEKTYPFYKQKYGQKTN